MSNVTENQKYLQSVHDELKAKLISIFKNEDIKVRINIDDLDNSDLFKFAGLYEIEKGDFYNWADILGENFTLYTKSKLQPK